jgi:hypothetical protein
MIFAFAYDVYTGLEGLLPVFFVGGVPLAVVATFDVLSWRRIRVSSNPSLARRSVGEATRLAAAGLPLLLFGALFTVIEVGVGGVKDSDFAVWTSTAVGYLILASLGAQTVLLVLTWLMRRSSLATGPAAT